MPALNWPASTLRSVKRASADKAGFEQAGTQATVVQFSSGCPQGEGGVATGVLRSKATRNMRSEPGRESSYTNCWPGTISMAQTLVTDAAEPSRRNRSIEN